ncbi:hypothetical protein [uncultured Methylobacterium sp.]|uniref:hypothetical protein n=1 Tax=uncultured Methylobacterium sp. TaxID=157278 RepID=UPI00261FBDA3|nr:hypothetical protein [uncultured Methylobacterium sp.]
MFRPAPRPDWNAAERLAPTLRFVDPVALVHLSRGLTFDALRCAEVLDHALCSLEDTTGYVEKLSAWIAAGSLSSGPCPAFSNGRIIVDVSETANASGQHAHVATVLRHEPEAGVAPVVFLSMVSPTLDVGMRVEIPLRTVMRGNAPLDGTYTVYQHVLRTSEGGDYLYYGITKRGWNLRFHEHTLSAVAKPAKRLFARTMNELIDARVAELSGAVDLRPKLGGLITAICAVGLSRQQAMETEDYLINKYSLASKHRFGLNMIPGGTAGGRHARYCTKDGPGR